MSYREAYLTANFVSETEIDKDQTLFSKSIFVRTSKPTIVLKRKSTYLNVLIDTGSEKTIVNNKTVPLFDDNIEKSNVIIKGINGTSNVLGEINLELNLNLDKKFNVKALVIKTPNFLTI